MEHDTENVKKMKMIPKLDLLKQHESNDTKTKILGIELKFYWPKSK